MFREQKGPGREIKKVDKSKQETTERRTYLLLFVWGPTFHIPFNCHLLLYSSATALSVASWMKKSGDKIGFHSVRKHQTLIDTKSLFLAISEVVSSISECMD